MPLPPELSRPDFLLVTPDAALPSILDALQRDKTVWVQQGSQIVGRVKPVAMLGCLGRRGWETLVVADVMDGRVATVSATDPRDPSEILRWMDTGGWDEIAVLADSGMTGVVRLSDVQRYCWQQTRREKTEQALALAYRESMEQSLTVGIAATDFQGRQVYVNDAFVAMVGWPREELMGALPPYCYWPPEEYERIEAAFQEALISGSPPQGWELVFRRRNGERFPVRIWATTWHNEAGEDIARIGFIYDLSQGDPRSPEHTGAYPVQVYCQLAGDGILGVRLVQPIDWQGSRPPEQARLLNYAFDHQHLSYANPALWEHYGFTEATSHRLTPRHFFARDPRQRRQQWHQLFDQGRVRCETQARRPDGTLLWLEGNYTCLYDPWGRIIGYFGIQRDITPHKHLYEQLRQAQEHLTSLTQIHPTVIYQFNPDDGGQISFPFINQAIQDLYECAPEDMQRQPQLFLERVHPQDRPGVEDSIRQAVQRQAPWQYEYRICLPSGTTKWVAGQSVAHPLDQDHCVWTGSLWDITRRKEAELALQEQRQMLHSLANGIPGYMQRMIWDPARHTMELVYVSAGVEAITGVSCEALYRDPWGWMQRLIHAEDQARWQQFLTDLAHTEEHRLTLRVVNTSGETRWLQHYARTQPDTSHPNHDRLVIDSVLVDITSEVNTTQINTAILNAIPDLLLHLDAEGRYLNFFYHQETRLYAGQPLQLGGKKDDYLPPDLAARWHTAIDTCLHSGALQVFEQCLEIGGERRYEEVRMVPMNGLSVLATVRDITAEKLTQVALAESEACYRLLAEHSSDLIVLCTPEGIFHYVSPASERLLGYTPEDLVGRSAYDFQHPDDLTLLQDFHQQILNGMNFGRIKHRLRHRDQHYVWVESTIKVVYHPNSNRIQDIQSTVRDISESIHYETMLQEANAQLRYEVDIRNAQLQQALHYESLVQRITAQIRGSLDEADILQTAITQLGTGLHLQRCLIGLVDLHSQTYSTEYEWIATPASDLHHSRIARLDESVWQQLLKQPPMMLPVTCSTHDDFWGWMTMILAPFRLDAQLWFLMVCRPVEATFSNEEIRLVEQIASQCEIGLRQARLYQTAQHQVQKLKEVNELKDDFIHMVSHELRTPLTNMNLAIKMLELSRDPERHQYYLRSLKQAWKQELDLVNDLLELQAIESGSLTPVLSAIDLPQWLAQLVEPFYDRCRQHQQELQVCCDPGVPTLMSDQNLLSRVVLELLNNACKYTPSHHDIRLTITPQPTIIHGIQIQVTNSGVTIPPEEQGKIFEKFHRIRRLDLFNQGGTGLGLALVRKAVTLLRGHLTLTSQEQLTTFTLILGSLPPYDQPVN
ncbi:MAG: hypothetical protein OHK0012_15530 [Synechococcales cyanobacterium]